MPNSASLLRIASVLYRHTGVISLASISLLSESQSFYKIWGFRWLVKRIGPAWAPSQYQPWMRRKPVMRGPQ